MMPRAAAIVASDCRYDHRCDACIERIEEMNRTRCHVVVMALLIGLLSGISGQARAAGADFCWAETTGRNAGTIPTTCTAAEERNGALCYPKCATGYSSDGVLGCIQNCPANATNDGLFCGWPSYKVREYPAWDRAVCFNNHPTGCWQTVPTFGLWVENCKAGFKHVLGFCEKITIDCAAEGLAGSRIANSCAKKLYARETILPACGSGQEYDAGLCYTPCSKGTGVGPMCWQPGPPGWVQCGMGWAETQAICDQNIASQVISVVDAVVSTTVLIGSVGASATAVSAKQATKSVFTKGAWTGLQKITKANVKEVLLKTARTTAISSMTSVPDAVLTTTNGAIENIWDIGRLQHDSPAMTQVERDYAIAQVALNTAAWFDPTGITGVVAAYSKPLCKDVSAMTPVVPSTAPEGAVATLMENPQSVQTAFGVQIQSAQVEYDAAAAALARSTAAYIAAPAVTKPALQVQMTVAQVAMAVKKAELDRVKLASAQFNASATKWQAALQ